MHLLQSIDTPLELEIFGRELGLSLGISIVYRPFHPSAPERKPEQDTTHLRWLRRREQSIRRWLGGGVGGTLSSAWPSCSRMNWPVRAAKGVKLEEIDFPKFWNLLISIVGGWVVRAVGENGGGCRCMETEC